MDEEERALPVYSQNFSELRRNGGITLVQLAIASDVELDDICRIERGLRRPDDSVRRKLLIALRYDPDDFDDDFRPRKGKHHRRFRGGKQKDRDPDFGINDPEFWHWWHLDGKPDSGGGDIENSDDAHEWHEHWKAMGCPVPKATQQAPNTQEDE
jgi:transcriptional regulator with XRE-family HTH domain